ncbi:MAG TPA: diguanylate cyclase [Mycobacteriales bacterium]|nr:diguanylate cyclase [Mycobacteriales bacterium]
MTLRWRLTLAFALVVLVPLLVGAVLVARAFPDALGSRQATAVSSSTRLVGALLSDYCDRARTTAEAAGRAATASTPAEAKTAAASLVARGMADGISVTGKSGRAVATVGTVPSTPADCASGRADDGHLAAVVPLLTPRGDVVGTSVASFDVARTLLPRLLGALGDGEVAVVADDGKVVAQSEVLPGKLVAQALRHAEGVRTDGWVAAGLASAAGQPFAVVVAQRSAEGPGLLVDAGVVILLALVAAVGIAVFSARATTRPLEALNQAASRVAAGDLSTLIEVTSKDEIGALAHTFNAMTEDLRTYVGQLQASRDELQNGLARLGETLAGSHDLDRILHVVLESAMASTRASGGMVMLLNPGRDQLVLAASQGVEVPLDLRLPMGEGITGSVATGGEPVRGRVGHGPGELWPAPGEPTGTSCIAVPLKSSGTVIGVLDLFGSELPGGFDDTDLATIRTFAAQATVAVDNVLLHEEAQRLSITDGLTGLWNYRYFTMSVTKEIERASRFGRPLALLMLDLDHFKEVNDSYGHQRGDAVLVELAGRIRAEARDVDTVARYGGEEIVVVLPETDEAGARQAAERFCSAVRRKAFGDSGQPGVRLTISAGVAVYPMHGGTASSLLASADSALYEAKRAGRDTWRVSMSEASR